MATDPWAVVGKSDADQWAVVSVKGASKSPGLLQGSLAQFNQGLSLGGADEIVAGAEALTGGDYRQSVERQKAERQAFQSEHPYLSAGLTAAGAVAPVVASTVAGTVLGTPAGGVAAATGTGARAMQLTRQALGLEGAQAVGRANTVVQAAREGARAATTPGAVAGYLSADPGERATGAATGAVLGAGLGAGLGGGIQAAQNVGDRVSPYLQRVAQYLGVTPSTASYAVPPTGGGGNVTPITRDEAMILQRMEEGGVTPETASLLLQKARRAGVPLALVDVGGQPVQRLTRGVRSLPGEGSAIIDDALTSRAAAAPERIVGHVERGIGRKATGNSGAVSDSLLRQARNESSPFYQRLEQLPPIKDKGVADIFAIPAVRDIVKRAEANAVKFGRPVNPLFDEDGGLLRDPTFADVDMVKQSIDEMLRPSYNMGPRPESMALATRAEQTLARNVRAQLLSRVNKVPGGATYQSARESYAGPARAREQYGEGMDFTRKDTSLEDVIAQRRNGSPADRKWYDRGVAEGIRARVMGVDDLTGQPNTLRQFWGNPEARAKVNALVSPRRAEMFNERLSMENQAAQTNNFVRSGSQTADKAAEAIDVAADVVTSGGPKAIASAAAQKAWERVRLNANEATRARVARHLVNMDSAQQVEFLNRLAQLQKQGQVNANQIATVASVVTKQRQSSR